MSVRNGFWADRVESWTGVVRGSYGVPVPATGNRSATVRTCAALAAALLLAAGCAGGIDDGTPLPTRTAGAAGTGGSTAAGTTGPPTGTPTAGTSGGSTDVDRTDVLAVYTAWWRALQAAYARGDAADPALADYAVDPILSRQRASIQALRAQGVVQRTTFALQPRLRYRTDRYAEVEDCVRGPANTYYDAITGRPRAPRGYRNDVPTEDRLLMTLQRQGDQWFVVAATGRGEVAC